MSWNKLRDALWLRFYISTCIERYDKRTAALIVLHTSQIFTRHL